MRKPNDFDVVRRAARLSVAPMMDWIDMRKYCFEIQRFIVSVFSKPYQSQTKIGNFWEHNMNTKSFEVAARAKLLEMLGTDDGEFGPTVFVSHHKEELSADYWASAFGNADPLPDEIIRGLVMVDSWSSEDDDNIDTFDFSLPGEVTNYLLSVRFDGDEIADVSMES